MLKKEKNFFLAGQRRAPSTERGVCPDFLFIVIVIVEKKITVIVIFFSTVVGIVIGMHCNALHHDKVKE